MTSAVCLVLFAGGGMCRFFRGAFTVVCLLLLLMRSANMSEVGRAVVKYFATRGTSEGTLGCAFFVCLEMFIKI